MERDRISVGVRPIAKRRRGVLALLGALIVAMLVSGVVLHRLNAQSGPIGLVEQPRLTGINVNPADPRDRDAGTEANLNKPLTVSGYVNFAPGRGELWIQIANDGDSFTGNGWTEVRVISPSRTTRIVNGARVWNFSVGPFRPFLEAVEKTSWANPWPDGGTARIRVVAFRYSDGAVTILPVRDKQGKLGSLEELVLSDYNLTPATQDQYYTPLYPVPGFLTVKGSDLGTGETEAYYHEVYVDKSGSDVNLPLDTTLMTLKDFKDRYFGGLANCPSSNNLGAGPAVYFNKGDLGIGREMRCAYNDCTKETACYVKNYGKRDGTALFTNDKSESKRAYDARKPFATVAMVSRGLMSSDAPNKVFFAVYGHAGLYATDPNHPLAVQDRSPLAKSAQLDNAGQNKFIPGNCLVCHGGSSSYQHDEAQGVPPAVLGALFLPFDLENSFDYYSTDPANALSRAKQEGRFKKLNQIVATTDLYTTLPNAKAMLAGWYGASASDPPSSWPSVKFIDGWIPANNWNMDDNARQLYKQVFAKFCRTCHISNASVDFGDWDDMVNWQFEIRDRVCHSRGSGIMPNAEATVKALWRSSGRSQMVNRMNDDEGCGLGGP